MARHSSTVLSPAEWAAIINREAITLHRQGKLRRLPSAREIAEAVGVIQVESGGNYAETGGAGGASGHIGAWQEEASYGSTKERLSAGPSTRSALLHWQSSGFSWWPDWGRWETGAAGGAGPTQWSKYMGAVRAALGGRIQVRGESPAGGTNASTAPGGEGGEGGGLSGDFMHIGLVFLLVVGGAALLLWGVLRLSGAMGARAA